MIDRDEFLKELKEEQRLRKVVRGLLENYLSQKKDKVMLEENRLRGVIRSLIKEVSADVPDEQPQRSTGINVLEDTLKVIIPIIEDAYKGLTTSKEQRDSFRAHILNAVENSLAPVDVTSKADASQEESDLEEEVSLDIDVEDDDRFIPVRDQDQPEEVAPEEEASFQDLSGLNVTGRNFASTTFNKIENQIQDAYESLADEEDRKLYKDYMLTNLKLYFDRFEEELQPTVPEPESPDYNK
jgi:predicted CopG family antitoxin